MKEKKITIKAISLFLIVSFVLVACSFDKKDWKKAKRLGSIPAYEDFIKIHPESEFIDSANYFIEDLYFQECQSVNTDSVYNNFINKFPDSKFVNSAKHNIEVLRYQTAKKQNSIEPLIQFIYDYPESEFVENAKTSIREYKEHLIASDYYLSSVTQYDDYGRIGSVVLKNVEGKIIAALNVEYDGLVIVKIDMIDRSNNETFHTITHDVYGRPKNEKHPCLDFNGNLIKRNGVVVLIDSFNSYQKSVSEFQYNGSFRTGKITKIYPCATCSSELNIPECFFVW